MFSPYPHIIHNLRCVLRWGSGEEVHLGRLLANVGPAGGEDGAVRLLVRLVHGPPRVRVSTCPAQGGPGSGLRMTSGEIWVRLVHGPPHIWCAPAPHKGHNHTPGIRVPQKVKCGGMHSIEGQHCLAWIPGKRASCMHRLSEQHQRRNASVSECECRVLHSECALA